MSGTQQRFQEFARRYKEQLRGIPQYAEAPAKQLHQLALAAYRKQKAQKVLAQKPVQTAAAANPGRGRQRVNQASDCPDKTIFNPRTRFCVKRDSRLGKQLTSSSSTSVQPPYCIPVETASGVQAPAPPLAVPSPISSPLRTPTPARRFVTPVRAPQLTAVPEHSVPSHSSPEIAVEPPSEEQNEAEAEEEEDEENYGSVQMIEPVVDGDEKQEVSVPNYMAAIQEARTVHLPGGVKVRREVRDLGELYEPNPKLLGCGQFGTVYRVRRLGDPNQQWMALKEIRLYMSAVEEKEAEEWRVTHPDECAAPLRFEQSKSGARARPQPGTTEYAQWLENVNLAVNELNATLRLQIRCAMSDAECAMVQVYDYYLNAAEDRFYIELEYIEGGDGDSMVDDRVDTWRTDYPEGVPKTNADLIVKNFLQVARTLDMMHDDCLLHRDLKPANLLWDSAQQRLFVADFGISCFTPHCSAGMKGTLPYLDPRVILQLQPRVGENSDVYSLGVTFYEMLFKHPYLGPQTLEELGTVLTPARLNRLYNGQLVVYSAEERAMLVNVYRARHEDARAKITEHMGRLSPEVRNSPYARMLLAIENMMSPFEQPETTNRPRLAAVIGFIGTTGNKTNAPSVAADLELPGEPSVSISCKARTLVAS